MNHAFIQFPMYRNTRLTLREEKRLNLWCHWAWAVAWTAKQALAVHTHKKHLKKFFTERHSHSLPVWLCSSNNKRASTILQTALSFRSHHNQREDNGSVPNSLFSSWTKRSSLTSRTSRPARDDAHRALTSATCQPEITWKVTEQKAAQELTSSVRSLYQHVYWGEEVTCSDLTEAFI